ncbi:MAG: hypothetical protein WC955_04770 [Elusimicrobiota bacterium]
MKKALFAISVLIIIYLLGVMSGFLSIKHFSSNRRFGPPMPDGRMGKSPEQHMVDMFSKKLSLTEAQKKQIVQILISNKGVVDKYRDEFYDKMTKTMNTVNISIRTILNEEQKISFDKMLKEAPKQPEFRGPVPQRDRDIR